MRRQSSRIVLSLKGRLKSSKLEPYVEEESPGGVGATYSPSLSKWNWDIANSRDIVDFLSTGRSTISTSRLESLKWYTESYLDSLSPNLGRPSNECDQILGDLISQHWKLSPAIREVAIISCLPSYSIESATTQLLSLDYLDIDHYLRCILLASQIDLRLISREESACVQTLLQILANQSHSIQKFGVLITGLISNNLGRFTCSATIRRALAKSNIIMSMQLQIQRSLDSHRYLSVYKLLLWLQPTSKPSVEKQVLAILDEYLPNWYVFAIWRPNLNRITAWEQGKFDQLQRHKLTGFFRVDGPDLNTCQQASLGLVEPDCYKITQIRPENQDILESSLDTLYEASRIGPGAVNLFIHAFIERLMCRRGRQLVESGIRSGSNLYCRLLVLSEVLHNASMDVAQAMDYVIEALEILADPIVPDAPTRILRQIGDCLQNAMSSCQVKFRGQLEAGGGELLGLAIQRTGKAAERAKNVYRYLPAELVENITMFPSQETLEVMFTQLEDDGTSHSLAARLRSYLVSSIGGEAAVTASSICVSSIQEELEFWKGSPDTLRKDFARKLSEVKTLDHTLYTKCILATLEETDLYIEELKNIITPDEDTCCIELASYLGERRELGQLRDECWLSLLTSLLNAQTPDFFPRIADEMPFKQWVDFSTRLNLLVAPIRPDLPPSGAGLTIRCLKWWQKLSQHREVVEFLLKVGNTKRRVAWIYFPRFQKCIVDILNLAKDRFDMDPLHLQIISTLDVMGSNSEPICNCIDQINNLSKTGKIICEKLFSRKQKDKWRAAELDISFGAWEKSALLPQTDKIALQAYKNAILPSNMPLANLRDALSRRQHLQINYEALLDHARELEAKRLKIQHKHPQKAAALLERIGVEFDSIGRVTDTSVPNDLADAIEVLGNQEYELSFVLTALTDLHRHARGISSESRILLVRICLKDEIQFCIHMAHDEGGSEHQYWQPSRSNKPPSRVCTAKPTLFTYYVGSTLHNDKSLRSLESIYRKILALITKPPATCITCSAALSSGLWKPTACSASCSIALRAAPLEVRLHSLMIDPLSIDFLLTCVVGAARETNLQLLGNCPFPTVSLAALIDSFPVLETLKTSSDLRKAIKGTDGLGANREKLLSWLCLSFRGFMITTPHTFRIPSMPNTIQFLLPNSHHERESAFLAQTATTGASHVVFHGTQISRMFSILTNGLKVMSGTSFQAHGAIAGAGIYCGTDQRMSSHYAGSTGPSWRNSALKNMSVMLGCEVATNAQMTNQRHFTMVYDENSILVRYIFLLPAGYQYPPQHHVGPAMSTAFQALRTGRGG